MKILFVLAWRNLWRNKRRTLIAVSSVLFAVVLASALLSFAEGFQQQLVETIVRQETGGLSACFQPQSTTGPAGAFGNPF